MAAEEPQVGGDVQLGDDLAAAVLAAVAVDLDDAVDHQHVGQGQPGIAGAEQLALAAGDQFFFGVAVLGNELGHVSPWDGRRRAGWPVKGADRAGARPVGEAVFSRNPQWYAQIGHS